MLALGAAFAAFWAALRGPAAAIAAFPATVVVVLTALDIERHIIPNRIVLSPVTFVLVARLVFFSDHSLELGVAALRAATVFLIPD